MPADDDPFLTVLHRHLPEAVQPAGLSLESPFVELGFDSMTTIQLLLDLEETFDVVFPEEMLSEEVLRSPRSLADALAAVQAAPNTV